MREEINNWWRQAEADMENAEKNCRERGYYLTVFLCQQAVEKALKAYYIKAKNTSPGKTHSIIYMATEVNMPEKFSMFLRRLATQYIPTRYPDAAYGAPVDLYDKETANDYLKETREAMAWLKSKIVM